MDKWNALMTGTYVAILSWECREEDDSECPQSLEVPGCDSTLDHLVRLAQHPGALATLSKRCPRQPCVLQLHRNPNQ